MAAFTTNAILKGTGAAVADSSSLSDDATTLAYATNKFTVTAANGNTAIAGTLAVTGAVTQTAKTTTYNNEATAGEGLAAIRGLTSQKAVTNAGDTNVLTVTPPAAVGTYRLSAAISLSSATSGVVGWTATWVDSNGNAQSPTNLSLIQSGTAAPALTFTTSAAGNYHGSAVVELLFYH